MEVVNHISMSVTPALSTFEVRVAVMQFVMIVFDDLSVIHTP